MKEKLTKEDMVKAKEWFNKQTPQSDNNNYEPEPIPILATEDFWIEFDQACTEYVNKLKQK